MAAGSLTLVLVMSLLLILSSGEIKCKFAATGSPGQYWKQYLHVISFDVAGQRPQNGLIFCLIEKSRLCERGKGGRI